MQDTCTLPDFCMQASAPCSYHVRLSRMLAAAFVEKHMRYLSFETDHLLAVIKMLMRYHYPAPKLHWVFLNLERARINQRGLCYSEGQP